MPEKDNNNLFIKEKLLEPRAKLDPKLYEYVALYSALYQTIFGSYSDYGFTDRATVDIFIDMKIETMMRVIDKIFKANPNATFEEIMSCKFEPDGPLKMPSLSGSDTHYLDEKIAFRHIIDNYWIQSYFPLLKTKKKILRENEDTGLMEEQEHEVVSNSDYAKKFLSNYQRVKGIAKDLVGRVGNDHKAGGMLTIPAAQQLLKAEQNQLSALFEGYRTASTGNAFKWDKEGKKYGSGAFYEAFKGKGTNSAVNQLREKKYFIRRSWGKFLLKAVGFLAAATLTISSAGLFLSAGAVTTIFGTAFAGMGLGSTVTGALGSIVGGAISYGIGGSLIKEAGYLHRLYKDKREFMNGVGKYAPTKDGPRGYNLLKEQYLTADGLKNFFNNLKKVDLNLSDEERTKQALKLIKNKEERKLVKKYIEEEPTLVSHARFYDVVDNQSGTMQELYRKLSNVVQGVPEQDTGRRMFASEATTAVRNVIDKKETDFKELIKTSKLLEDYKDKIGDVNTNEFRLALANSYANAFSEHIFNKPYTKYTMNLTEQVNVPEVKSALESSSDGTAMKNVDANFTFLKTVKTPYAETQKPLKLDVSLGVSVEQQVCLTKKAMVDACSSLCDDLTDEEKAKIELIATQIQDMKNISEATTIETNLSGLDRGVASEKFNATKKYLNAMLNKRKATSKLKDGEIADEILPGATAIPPKVANISKMIQNLNRNSAGQFETKDSLGRTKSIIDIREQIMDGSTGLTDEQQKSALDILDKQVIAIENREFLDTEAGLVPIMQEGRFNSITDLMKFINELKFEDIASNKISDWYDDKVKRNSNKAFLEVQLKTRLEAVVMAESKDNKYSKKDISTLDEIVKFIQSVKACRIFDDAQKIRIISSMQGNIEQAVRIKINATKKNFATEYNPDDFNKLIDRDSGILRDFFELKTPESIAIRQELVNLSNLSDLKETITANMDGGTALQEDQKEARAFSLVYMFHGAGINRSTGDALYDIIKTIKEDTTTALGSMSNFKVSGRAVGASPMQNPFINKMKQNLNTIIGTGSPMNDYEKYAALIMLKKNCIAAFKSHVLKFRVDIVGSGRSFQNYLTDAANKDNFIKQVYESWVYDDGTNKGLLNLIDESLNNIKSRLATASKIQDEEYYAYSAIESAQKSYGDKTADEYGRSASR